MAIVPRRGAQITASSSLLIVASLAFSYSSPMERMHPVRPLRSLFHPSIIISTIGQALIHIACIVYGVKIATEAMGPEALQEVSYLFCGLRFAVCG